jgi:integrase
VTAAAVTVMTALERHKPSAVQQYNVGRRLAARWMKAEGLAHLTFASFRHLVWDLEDAGYCGSTLRLVHNALREVVETANARPFYWEDSAFRLFYLGQSARMSRAAADDPGRRGPHAPIDRARWRELLQAAAREPDAESLARFLLLMFPLYMRIGEAASVRNADIKFGADARPCGILLKASSSSSTDWSAFDIRPKGALLPGGKEWAPAVDDLAVEALLRVVRLSERGPSERRFNSFIRQVASAQRWGPGWWSSHGLRHGRVQDRLRARAPPDKIQSEGRWRSRAAFEVYLS